MQLKVIGKDNQFNIGQMCNWIDQSDNEKYYNRMIKHWTHNAMADVPRGPNRNKDAAELVCRLEQFYQWIITTNSQSLFYSFYVIKIGINCELPEYLAECIYYLTKDRWPDDFYLWADKIPLDSNSSVISLFRQYKSSKPVIKRKKFIGTSVDFERPKKGQPCAMPDGEIVVFSF